MTCQAILSELVASLNDSCPAKAFQLIGAAVVALLFVRCFAFLARLALSPRAVNWKRLVGGASPAKTLKSKAERTSKRVSVPSEANWAAVSGASDGIGREFALQLARKGFNIFLIGRNQEKLSKVQKEIELSGRKTEAFLLDYADPEQGVFEKLNERASKLPITVLVNNAGVSHELPTPFAEERPAVIEAIVQVNCLSTVQVTRAILPGMLSRKLGGLILNMGSVSAELKTPLLQTYAGSKAFLRTWSEALAVEVARERIHVELLNTHFVTTNMSKIRRSSFTCPTPREYVAAVLSRCGSASFSTLHPGHALVFGAMSAVPAWILKPVVLKQMLATRKHALSKAAKAK